MSSYISVKKSQIYQLVETPLYIKRKSGDYVLYKAENVVIDDSRFSQDEFPELYIPADLKETAISELNSQLQTNLFKQIKTGDLKAIKNTLCEIVRESMTLPFDNNLKALPETIDILYSEYANTGTLLRIFTELDYAGTSLIDHSVGVMLLTLNYCLCSNYSEKDTKTLSLGALLHDVGLTKLPTDIAEANDRLSKQDFIIYKKHTSIGHQIIKKNFDVNKTIGNCVYEHHERLDGKGYPEGTTNISFEGSLIGLIDSFENLTNTEKKHRKRMEPFDALNKMKHEVLVEGRYYKKVFKEFCLSLSGKFRYS